MRSEAKYAIAFIAPARRRNVTIPPSAFPSHTVPIAQPKTTKMPVSNTKRAKVRRYAPMDSHPTEWYLLSTRTSLINLMREGRRGSEAQDVRVSFHVHESVAAHVERDDAALPALLRFEGLIHRACDAVGALRGGQEALRLNEHARPLEHVSLVGRVCDRVDQSAVAQEGEDRRAPVIPQPIPPDRFHRGAVAEGVHLQHRRERGVVREVVSVPPLEVRGRGALRREEADFLAAERICEERKGESPEIRAAAEAGDHQVRIFADLLELPLGLEADDRLMEEDMVQDGAEAVDRLVIAPRVFEAFRHRDAQGAWVMRVFLEQGPSGRRLRTRGSVDCRAVQPHELAALRLPIVDRADPEDRRLQAREARRVREGRAPLPRPGFRREALVPLLLRIPGLRERRIHLVAAGRTVELGLVVQMRGSTESFLETACPDQRPRSTRLAVQVLNLRRDVDPSLHRVLLAQAFADQQVRERLDSRRAGRGILRGRQGLREIRLDVVPLRWPLIVRELHDERIGLRHQSPKIRWSVMALGCIVLVATDCRTVTPRCRGTRRTERCRGASRGQSLRSAPRRPMRVSS